MTAPLIQISDLCKSYDGIEALCDLHLQLNRGEIVGLLGPNGAGKTTAIQMILGLLTPTSGSVSVLGLNPIHHLHKLSKQVNFSSAYGNLPSNLTVNESLTVFSRLYNISNAKEKMKSLLALFEIADLGTRVVGALSSGEKTRLNLAKALLNDPILLVLDEPTSSLDPDMAAKVRDLLKKIYRERNVGILYTSHNMFEVEILCNRLIFIHKGKMIAEGTPEDIRKRFTTSSLDEAFIKMARGGELTEGASS